MCQWNDCFYLPVLAVRIFSGLGNGCFPWYIQLGDSVAFVVDSLEHLFLAAIFWHGLEIFAGFHTEE